MQEVRDNVTRAENQQERLMRIGWIVGFVDGEGCFSIGFVQQTDRDEKWRMRRGYRTGWQVSHDFVVSQGEKSLSELKMMQEFFGIGHVTRNTRRDNHKEHMWHFTVHARDELLNVIIPFFERFPLRTSKRLDFSKFAKCVRMMKSKQHLTSKGLVKIATIAATMNRRKNRRHLIRILRYYTPTTARR